MSLAQSLSIYITLNILVALGFLITRLSFSSSHKFGFEISSRVKLQICYWSFVGIFAIVGLQPFMPKSDIFTPTAKVWSAESVKSFYTQYSEPTDTGYLAFSVSGNPVTLKSQDVVSAWMITGLVLFLFGGASLLKDFILLFRIKRNSYLFKKIGRVSVFLNDHIRVPFSYFHIGFTAGANVIVPSSMLEKLTDFKIALSHELQHHRQKDTLWVYILWVMRIVCVANPFAHLWVREIFEMQEFACDEALIGRKKVESQSYARCLLEVAQTAIDQKNHLVCATGLTLLVERNLLKRRIEKMFVKQNDTKKSVKYALGIILGVVMSITAYASTSLVQDRRVSMKEANEFARIAKVNSNFPIVVNDLVLQELNRYLGTPEGRDFMRKALVRMETYRPLLNRKIQEYQMPEELMAVPIIESGYQNLPQSENNTHPRCGAARTFWNITPTRAAGPRGLFGT